MTESNLTIEAMYRAYDALYDFPEEAHFYICHPDQLAQLRAVWHPVRWGTCPLIRAHSAMEPGKVLQIKQSVDERWRWPWQQKEQR